MKANKKPRKKLKEEVNQNVTSKNLYVREVRHCMFEPSIIAKVYAILSVVQPVRG